MERALALLVLCLLCLTLALLVAPSLGGEGKPIWVVFDLEPENGVTEATAQEANTLLRTLLSQSEEMEVLSAETIAARLQRADKKIEGYVRETRTASELGLAVQADEALYGSVRLTEAGYLLRMKVVDVANRRLKRALAQTCGESKESLLDAITQAAVELGNLQQPRVPPTPVLPVPPPGLTCPKGMMFIPAGSITYAVAVGTPDSPQMYIAETTDYCIDTYEHPNDKGVPPRAATNWLDAAATCEVNGKRLCSGPEFVRACKGPEGLPYPYGPRYRPDKCNDNAGWDGSIRTSKAGAFTECVSGYGVYDLVGNLAEWTFESPAADAQQRVHRGGMWSMGQNASCDAWGTGAADEDLIFAGFRCCAELVPQ